MHEMPIPAAGDEPNEETPTTLALFSWSFLD